MKKTFFASLGLVVAFTFTLICTGWAADFTAWDDTWFKTTVSRSGFRAPILPGGGKVVSERVRAAGNVFVHVNSCDIGTTSCSLDVCAIDSQSLAWVLHPDITVTTLSGSALDFLTLLEFEFTESTGNTFQFRIPLRIKGTEDRKVVNTIKTASANSSGGLFVEWVGNPATQVGVGGITLNGSFIPRSRVSAIVPGDCTKAP